MRTFFAACFVLAFGEAQAQSQSVVDSFGTYPTKHFLSAVTVSPLALAQLDNTFLMGAERKLSRRFALTAEAGYVFYSNHYFDGDAGPASGFVIRPALKYLLKPITAGGRPVRRYLQTQFYYKQVTQPFYRWIDRDVVAGVPGYQERRRVRFRREAVGANLILGRYLGRPSTRRLLFDLYAGIGVRARWVTGLDGATSEDEPGVNLTLINDADPPVVPNFAFGLRLVYTLR